MAVIKYNKNFFFISVLTALFFFTCSERNRTNPLDPESEDDCCPIALRVVSDSNRVDLYWDIPPINDLTGFSIYRKTAADTSFIKIAENLLPTRTSFTDHHIEPRIDYHYYITILGVNTESKPSPTVSTVPGPGHYWMVDKWGYQLVKTTYDVRTKISAILTDWPPSDMAIDSENGNIVSTFTLGNTVNVYDSETSELRKSFQNLNRPYRVEFDKSSRKFWLVDTSGYLYMINSDDFNMTLVDGSLNKPVDLAIDKNARQIIVCDESGGQLVIFNPQGNLIALRKKIGDYTIQKPRIIKFSRATNDFWLVDNRPEYDLLVKFNFYSNSASVIDTVIEISDVEPAMDGLSVWLTEIQGFNSKVLQLSDSGIRLLELQDFYYPYDISINKYDGTLAVCETGNGIVYHYDLNYQIFGNYQSLNFPVKIVIE